MTLPRIEHVNITVSDPARATELMKEIFGWHIRWEGPARDGGRAIHVGSDETYIALHSPPGVGSNYAFSQGKPLNHIGVQVEDLAAVEARVLAAGFETRFQGVYRPGPAHFYFSDHDEIEYEVVSYSGAEDSVARDNGQPEIEVKGISWVGIGTESFDETVEFSRTCSGSR